MINPIRKTINSLVSSIFISQSMHATINVTKEKPSVAAKRLFKKLLNETKDGESYELVAINPYTDENGMAIYWRPRFENQKTGEN